jgi:hypothetical protein
MFAGEFVSIHKTPATVCVTIALLVQVIGGVRLRVE